MFLIITSLYLKTACPTVYWGDSSELVSCAWTAGIPHPPGYPLFTMLGFLWSHGLDFVLNKICNLNLEPAFLMNLLNILISTIIILFLYNVNLIVLTKYQINVKNPICIIAGNVLSVLVFALSKTFWKQVIVTEVYTMYILLLLFAFYFILNWANQYTVNTKIVSNKYLYCAILIYGLLFSHHTSSLIYLPVFFLFILLTDKTILSKLSFWGKSIFMFILGLIPFIYLPIRANYSPQLNWGNPSKLINFWFLISAKDYQWAISGLSIKEIFINLLQVIMIFVKDYHFNMVLCILGILITWKKERRLSLFITSFMLINLLAVMHTRTLEKDAFSLPMFLFSSIFICVGIAKSFDYIINSFGKNIKFLFIIILALNIIPTIKSYKQMNYSKYRGSVNYVEKSLEYLDKNQRNYIFTLDSSKVFISYYLKYVMKRNNNCFFILKSMLIYDWYNQWLDKNGIKIPFEIIERLGKRASFMGDFTNMMLEEIVKRNKTSGKIYIDDTALSEYYKYKGEKNLYMVPSGLLFSVNDKNSYSQEVIYKEDNFKEYFNDSKTQSRYVNFLIEAYNLECSNKNVTLVKEYLSVIMKLNLSPDTEMLYCGKYIKISEFNEIIRQYMLRLEGKY